MNRIPAVAIAMLALTALPYGAMNAMTLHHAR
jgi:hypothetical protein